MRLFLFLLILALPSFAQAGVRVDAPEYNQGWTAYHAAEKATGDEARKFKQQALDAFEQACAKNDARACWIIVSEGFVTSALPSSSIEARRNNAAHRAAEIFDSDCQAGNQFSCESLGSLVSQLQNLDSFYPKEERTDGLPQYVSKAVSGLMNSCASKGDGWVTSCEKAAQLLKVTDSKRANALNTILCEQKADVVLQSSWDAACHEIGRLGKEDEKKLNPLYAQCASRAAACREAGIYWYQQLVSFPDHLRQARTWFNKGCSASDALSCAVAGQLAYDSKESGSLAQAISYVDRACNLEKGAEKERYCSAATKLRGMSQTQNQQR